MKLPQLSDVYAAIDRLVIELMGDGASATSPKRALLTHTKCPFFHTMSIARMMR